MAVAKRQGRENPAKIEQRIKESDTTEQLSLYGEKATTGLRN